MKLTRVQFCTHVAAPTTEVRGPRGLLMVQEEGKPPNASCCTSLELVRGPPACVVIDGVRSVPLSNVASFDPPPPRRGRPPKPDASPDS